MSQRLTRTSALCLAVLLVAGCSSAGGGSAGDSLPSPSEPQPVVSAPTPTVAGDSDPASAWPVAFRDVRHSGQAAVDGPTTGKLRWIRPL